MGLHSWQVKAVSLLDRRYAKYRMGMLRKVVTLGSSMCHSHEHKSTVLSCWLQGSLHGPLRSTP